MKFISAVVAFTLTGIAASTPAFTSSVVPHPNITESSTFDPQATTSFNLPNGTATISGVPSASSVLNPGTNSTCICGGFSSGSGPILNATFFSSSFPSASLAINATSTFISAPNATAVLSRRAITRSLTSFPNGTAISSPPTAIFNGTATISATYVSGPNYTATVSAVPSNGTIGGGQCVCPDGSNGVIQGANNNNNDDNNNAPGGAVGQLTAGASASWMVGVSVVLAGLAL